MIVYLLHHKSSCSGKAGARNAEETQRGRGATPRHSFECTRWGWKTNDIDLSKSATRNASTPLWVVAFLPSKGWCCARGKSPPFLSAVNPLTIKKMWKIKKIRADKLAVIEELTVTFSIQICEKVMFHDFFARLITF